MKRIAYKNLLEWKVSSNRKPLVLQGARQVGKTYLVDEFGKNEYENYIYLNFEQNNQLLSLFEPSLDPYIIIHSLGLYLGKTISAENTLIFFDEIQIAPRVLTSLKYFQEMAPEFHIIAAGSLLGVSINKQTSFPVGKVSFLTLYPLSFAEFLTANGEELFVKTLEQLTIISPFPDAIHQKMLHYLKLYFYLGGMPEVVKNYIEKRKIEEPREIQKEILNAYERDFSKYADKNQSIKNSEFWNSIPRQLARENKKFKYNEIKKNARAAMYDGAVEWLRKAGLIHLAYNINTPKLPLSAYADFAMFKVYFHDVGLLAAKLNIPSSQIVIPDALFTDFNGAFTENFVAQELICNQNDSIYYWTSNSDAEVDFIIQSDNTIIPLEVKSGTSLNTKSIRSYAEKYKPEVIMRVSPRNLLQSGNFYNIPLYTLSLLNKPAIFVANNIL